MSIHPLTLPRFLHLKFVILNKRKNVLHILKDPLGLKREKVTCRLVLITVGILRSLLGSPIIPSFHFHQLSHNHFFNPNFHLHRPHNTTNRVLFTNIVHSRTRFFLFLLVINNTVVRDFCCVSGLLLAKVEFPAYYSSPESVLLLSFLYLLLYLNLYHSL